MSLAPTLDMLAPASTRDGARADLGDALGRLVTREALAGAPADVALTPYLDWFQRTYGDDLVMVLLYGSVLSPALRAPTSTPDFIVVTGGGHVAAHAFGTRLLHGVLAPTSRSASVITSRGPGLFKYLHLDLSQLARATGPDMPDLFVAGRLSKRVRLVHVRDAAAREAALDALTSSVRNLAPLVRALLPPVFDLERFVLESLAISYRGEWRIEAPDKVERLARASWGHYADVYRALLDEQVACGQVQALPDGRFTVGATAAERRAALAMLRRTRVRAALRWPKHAITVTHAGELVAGKLERAHPGMRIPPFARRHPILCALPVLIWLLFRGALRSRPTALPAPATSARASATTLRLARSARADHAARPAEHARPRLALIANLGARRVRRRGFDALAYGRLLGEGAFVRGVDAWTELPAAVAEACAKGVDAILVLGGDGTLGAVVSELAGQNPERMPAVVPLCGGGFNMAARNLGATRSPWRDVKRLAARVRRGLPLNERAVRVLRVDDPAHAHATRHGFVFGAGVVYEYSRHISDHGGTGWWNSVRRTVGLTVGAFAGSARAKETWRRFSGALTIDHAGLTPRSFTAVCACAVTSRSSLIRPLPAARPPDSRTFSYLASALPREEILRRRLVSIVRGRCGAEHHLTGHATTLRLDSDCGYLLDGELVAPHERSREVVISAGPIIRFWLPRGSRTNVIATNEQRGPQCA